MLEIRHLQMLTALREQGSLAGAAEELHVTASAVSHQLKEIENYYGVSFVNRRSRPISFTLAGDEMLKLADSILPQFQQSIGSIRRLASGQIGQLRLASECHSCFDWLMPILNRYRKQWQEVELDFATAFEPAPHQMLLDKEIDILVTASALPMDGLVYLPLFEYESRLVLAPSHPLAQKKSPITPQDLATQTLIAYPVEASRLDVIAHFLEPAHVSPAKIRTTELTAMLIQLIASERGVGALPNWVISEYEKKGWVVSRALGEGVFCQLYVALRQNSQSLAYVQGFLQLLKEMVKP
ncbi:MULTISPECIES: LysR family transcriptional regulator [unclassified Moraxella]|uniref:LysR family transcriptional regulator n=1 Tax=unclassified Moraxella TaxID=2685852 RepID=UPI003AF9FF1A